MDKILKNVEKAYIKKDFINSSDARVIRILAELLEPEQRFHKYKIKDMVVFFGSARTMPPDVAENYLKNIEEKICHSDSQDKMYLQAELENAKNQVFMSRYYCDAVQLAKRLTLWSKSLNPNSRFIVCSGGGLGIMEASNRGANEAGGKSIGLNISIPMEQFFNQYITPELNFEFHYFFMRKFWFVYLTRGFAIFPGGFGTLDELFEVLTLLQTKKLKKQIPIVLYGSEYWQQVVNFDALVKYGTISRCDLDLFKICNTVEEAYTHLTAEITRLYL